MTILITALPTVPTNARTRCTMLSCTSRPTYIPHMPQASEHVQLTTTAPHHVPTLRCSNYTPAGAHALPLCHLPYSYVRYQQRVRLIEIFKHVKPQTPTIIYLASDTPSLPKCVADTAATLFACRCAMPCCCTNVAALCHTYTTPAASPMCMTHTALLRHSITHMPQNNPTLISNMTSRYQCELQLVHTQTLQSRNKNGPGWARTNDLVVNSHTL